MEPNNSEGEELSLLNPLSEAEQKKWDDQEHYEEITEYIRQVDEILDFMRPFPRDGRSRETTTQAAEPPRAGLNHLQNLIKLVEQLKDLKHGNSKLQERAQYLEDLKKLRERKKRLKHEADLELKKCWKDGQGKKNWQDGNKEETQTKKSKSSSPFRKSSRGRSKSVNIEELDEDRDVRFRRERFPSQEQPRRKSSSLLQKTSAGKGKVSKWTKVKEAFRWEKASHSVESRGKKDEVQYLQVPQDKASESASDSALSGAASATSSLGAPSTSCLVAVSSGYSGEHSSEGRSTSSGYVLDLPPPPPPPPLDDDFLSLPLLQDLSSSSSSEKLDELLSYSELLTQGSTAGSMDVSFHHHLLGLRREDDGETRRSKSLDGDMILGPSPNLVQHLSKESLTSSKLPKTHKTPWGKVKDIIQTRKDSLKKKPKKRGDELRREFSVSVDPDLEAPEELSSPEEKSRDLVFPSKPRIEVTADATEDLLAPCPVPKSDPESVSARRLTPVLTITLPSTEELSSLPGTGPETAVGQKPSTPLPEEKNKNPSHNLCEAEYYEDIPKYEKGKSGSYHRRFSRWTKVKKAFLTSTSPNRSPDYIAGPSSVPSSPNRHSSFFSDVESDELSSGEWAEDKIHFHDKSVNPELESPTTPVSIQVDIQKSYLELQHKLTREFNQKIREWERSKSVDSPAKNEEQFPKQKIEEWDRIPRGPARQRESMAVPLPTMEDLSPEFKKKLDEWKKIKKSQTTPAVPHALGKYEAPGPHFKMRIGEWQRWKPRSNKTQGYKPDMNLPDEFCKKLEEWQKIKGSERRSRSQSDRGKDDSGNRTPSPSRLSRKSSKGAIKKIAGSGKSSGTESLSGSLREKDGRGGARKPHKEKDLQWLEKELHKIEREKLRLEREREKYLEREARLEQMKRTMGTTSPTQEVLIKTPTGFFRFEGISQKFTKKLYEWEKARGIAPEASTFALLEECATTGSSREERVNGMSLQRSKSMGSVIEVSTSVVPGIAHHPSSLSLNDVDELEVLEETRLEEAEGVCNDEDEPQAIIVDVEDVVEETAALMADVPIIKGQVPVYSYAPAEVTQLIDSSGSDGEQNAHTQSEKSTELIDHNIDLLDKLEVKEVICRKLENDLENIEAQINEGKKTSTDAEEHDKDGQDQLRRDGEDLQHSFAEHSEQQANLAHDLVDKMKLLDEMTTAIAQQETVSRVHDLSSQLLCLAKKLEVALSERNEDVKNLRKTLYSRRDRAAANRLQSGHLWFSADGNPTSSGSLADKEALLQTLSTSPLAQELQQLPSQITNKVLELKCGLNILKNVTESPMETTVIPPEPSGNGLESTASFALRMPTKGTSDSFQPDLPAARRGSKVDKRSTPGDLTAAELESEERARKLEKSKKQLIFGETATVEFEKNSFQQENQIKNSPDVIKRRIKEKISLMQRMTTEARPRNFKPLEFNYNKHVDDDVTDDESPVVETIRGLGEETEQQDEKVVVVVKKNGKGSKQRKMLKTRRITDTTIAYKHGFDLENRTSSERDDSDDVFLNDDSDKRYPTYNNPSYIHFSRRCSDDSGPRSSTDVDSVSSAPYVNVFVPTTRKIISPVRRDSKGTTSSVLSYVIDDITQDEEKKAEVKVEVEVVPSKLERKLKLNRAQSASPNVIRKVEPKVETKEEGTRKSSSESGTSMECSEKRDIGIPPLPNSPGTGRKSSVKEAAPSIRMMIAKYNQKISEQDMSDAGSGTASPVAWRSPVFERRVQAQTEKYQDDATRVLKHGGKFGRGEVQKSASASFIRSGDVMLRNTSNESLQDTSPHLRGILKSSSVGTIKPPMSICNASPTSGLSPTVEQDEPSQPQSVLRALRIKRAKEEFLSRGPGGQSWTSETSQPTPSTSGNPFSWEANTTPEDKIKSRLSHISVGSESSFDENFETGNLIKSASAGMINEEQRELIRRCSEEVQDESELQKNVPSTSKSSKFGISSIKSKFRKVKMRKVKEKEGGKMNAVSTLCRQSLFLDVSNGSQRKLSMPSTSKSCPSSPVLERGKTKPEDAGSWIRLPARKIFRSKEPK